jgi:hypothetical protein
MFTHLEKFLEIVIVLIICGKRVFIVLKTLNSPAGIGELGRHFHRKFISVYR